MNEITRIHIAKTPYDIEIQAKKDLESYIKKLELYSDDANLLEDIEIRMTEILAERKIEKNGLISATDIDAMKEQLGEPKEFIGEGDIAVGVTDEDTPRRRLYRDLEGAALGGVLSGIARYLGVSAIWTRIAFLVITAFTFGTALFVYAILWIIIPPARTAAEKLESAGKLVTLASIKSLNESEVVENRLAPAMQAVVRYGLAIVLIISALAALIATGLGVYEFFADTYHLQRTGLFVVPASWEYNVAFGFLATAGVLLAVLLCLLATALFKKKWTKRFTVATIVVIAVGLLSFGTGAGIFTYKSWEQSIMAENSRTVSNVPLPTSFKGVEVLTSNTYINGGPNNILPVNVQYIVSPGAPRYELIAGNNTTKPVVTIDGNKASITIDAKYEMSNYYVIPSLTIYGPALEHITVNSSTLEYYNKDEQDNLTISTLTQHLAGNSPSGIDEVAGSFILKGSYGMVTASVEQDSSVNLNQASIQDLNVNLTSGYLNAGVVRTLHANQSDVCATEGNQYSSNRIAISGVSSKVMTFNGKEQKAETISGPCGVLIIGSEQEYDAQNL